MADQMPASVGEAPPAYQDSESTTSTIQPQSDSTTKNSNNLLGADILTGIMPGQGGGLSPLRVRRRGVRRLVYEDNTFEQDAESGDLGQHSLAHKISGTKSPTIGVTDAQPPVLLHKRLVSLRRKRADSPVPGPNLIDALTALLSPPSIDKSEAGGPLEGIIGLGIIQPPTQGLGIITPGSKDESKSYNTKGSSSKDFFANDDGTQDQSTPSFPKDEDFHRDPNADPPSRNGKKGSAKDQYEDKDEFDKEFDEEFDKYFDEKNDPFSSSGPAGNFFEDDHSEKQQEQPSFDRSSPFKQPNRAPAVNPSKDSKKPGEPKTTTPPQPDADRQSSAPPVKDAAPTPLSTGDKEAAPTNKESSPPDGSAPATSEAAPNAASEPAPAPDSMAPESMDTSSTSSNAPAPPQPQDTPTQSTEQSAPPPDSNPPPPAPDAGGQAAEGPTADQPPAPESAPAPPPDNANAAPEQQGQPAPASAPDEPTSAPTQPTPASEQPPAASEAPTAGDTPPADNANQAAEAPPTETPADPPAGSSDPPADPPSSESGEGAPQARRRAFDDAPQSLQQLRMRRSAERMRRASIPRRAVNPASVPQSETPYFSPAQTFSSPVFASSPLSRSWKPAQQTFSPNLYSSPTTSLESPEAAASCAFNGQPCVTTTPILTSPWVGYGASTFALSSPVLDGTPRMTQSPIMSPLMESSRRFTSPTPSYESRGFRTQAQYGSAETQGPAPGAPGSGFYNAVIATSIIGAAMCMGAFGILAWLLFRRRSPYQRPVISHPILKYSSTDSNNGDDENEKSPIQNSGQFRQVEAPTIPESVLPSNTWRPSMQYPVDGFGKPDHMMRDTVHTVRSHQSYHPEQAMSPDIMRNMPGALINNDHATYSHREHEVPLQRKASLGRQQNLSRPPPALMRHNSIHEDRHRARFADDPLYQPQINPPPEQQLQQSKSHHQPTEDHGNSHDPRQMEASVEGGRPPVPLRARSTSKSSISSQQQASWELRKAAIIASAHTTNADATRAPPTAASSPVNLDDTEVRNPAEPASPPSTVLSNSVSLVMLDKQLQEARTTAQKQRPISQDGSAVRNKLKKGSQYHGKKVRPVTIGAAPPSILVTNHPQALVPPPSPKPSQRMSLYSLTDTLPYLASSSQSMASLGTAMAQDDISLVDPMHSGRSSTQSYDRRTSFAESSIASEDGTYRCSLADSCRSEPTADPNTDEERAKRSQRRRTLLESVYKQEEEHRKAGIATQTSAAPHNGNDDPFTQQSDYQTPGKSSMRVKNKVLPQAALPLTPPYTPKDLPTVRAQEELSVETPTRRSRSVSAGEPVEQPSLDASLTRFSQIDLGSEFSLSKFGSIGSLKSAAKGDKDGNIMASSTEDRDSASSFKRSTNQNSKRLSVHGGETSASSGEAVAKPARRARASTISCDQFKANTTESMMTTAARVPLPLRSKATRVSFAPAAPSPPPTGTTRSIAQDLRASVNYPTGYDPSASRPNSYRTTMSSCRVSSDYDFDHVIDFADSARTSAFSTSSNGSASQHKRKDAMSRLSNGSLGVPDEDDDDGSVYSRESGSHESPWEIAKARVRARASLALPTATEVLA